MLVDQILNYKKRHGVKKTIFKIFTKLFEKLGIINPKPYEFVQNTFEKNIHHYLGMHKNEIKNMFIVGAHEGREVRVLSRSYPECEYYLFEPYPKYFSFLEEKFRKRKDVNLLNLGISSKVGEMEFYQTNIDGSGSLFKPNNLANSSYNMKVKEKIKVNVTTLDNYIIETKINMPDLLWIDVQGHEMNVLKGGDNSLEKIKAIFVEIAAGSPIYDGQVSLNDINVYLSQKGFVLCELGTDHENLTGNAIYINLRFKRE